LHILNKIQKAGNPLKKLAKKRNMNERIDVVLKKARSRMTSYPPGMCPLVLYRSLFQISMNQTCGKCVPCRDGLVEVTALAADQYSAAYSGDEIRESGRIYLAVEVNGESIEGIEGDRPGVQVIVFGDPDSRRMVRRVEILEIK